MEEQSEEWEIIEENGSGDSKMSLILNKGWRVGKKIMITGVVISSAPIVLPPLLVFSTLGFAFSVPFGLFFVSYACTDKLMSKLLSRPPTEEESEVQMAEEEEGLDYVAEEALKPVEGEIGKERTDEDSISSLSEENEAPVEEEQRRGSDERVIEESEGVEGMNERVEVEGKPVKENLGDTQKEEEFTRESNEQKVDEEHLEERDKEKNIGVQNEQNAEEAKVEKKPKEETMEIEEVKKPTTDVEGTTVEIKDENKKEERIPVEEVEQANVGKERMGDVDIVEQEKKPSEGTVQIVEGNKDQENDVARVEEDRPVEERKPTGEESENREITEANEPKQTSSEVSSSAVEEHSSVDNVSEASQDSLGHPVPEAAESRTAKGAPRNKTAISSKEAYSEETIFEQIDALRKIVGYKVAPQVTSMEEVKALYVFTGVEPPSAFKDPTDLVEVSDKLRLLMSIVGVK